MYRRPCDLRHKVAQAMRKALCTERGFMEVETPILGELHARGRARLPGAQPSRNPGSFYALPQTPAAATSSC